MSKDGNYSNIPGIGNYIQGFNRKEDYERQLKIQRDLGLIPEPVVVDATQSGVFVELIDGKPVVSIRCSDSSKLDELTALARRIMDSIR